MSYSLSDLQKLKSAYASGVLKVRFGDQEVTYKSESEMRKTIETMEKELKGQPKPKISTFRFSKDLD